MRDMDSGAKKLYLSLEKATSLYEKTLYLRCYIEALNEEIAHYETSPYLNKKASEVDLGQARYKLGGSQEEREKTEDYCNHAKMKEMALDYEKENRPSYMKFTLESSILVLGGAFALGVIIYAIAYLSIAGAHNWHFEYFDVTLNDDFFSNFLPESYCWGGRTLFFGVLILAILAFLIALCVFAPIYHSKADLYSYATGRRALMLMSHYRINRRKLEDLHKSVDKYSQKLVSLTKELSEDASDISLPLNFQGDELSYYFLAAKLVNGEAKNANEAIALYWKEAKEGRYPLSLDDLPKHEYASKSLKLLASRIKEAYGDFQKNVLEPNEGFPYRYEDFSSSADKETMKWLNLAILG